MVVRKARRMADQMNVPILGVVENMSGFVCSDCGTFHELFGPSHADEISEAPLLASLPIRSELARLSDAGDIESYEDDETAPLATAFLNAVPLKVPEPA